jgi:hypothetical protein
MTSRPRVFLLIATLSAAVVGPTACASSEEEEIAADDAAFAEAANQLAEEVQLLRTPEDLARLAAIVDARVADLEARKTAAKEQATADVEAYTAHQWERSWFTQDEKKKAISARSKDIFDRPERRALSGALAQQAIVRELGELYASGAAGTAEEPSERAAYLREGYVEISTSVALNGELGLGKQAGARIMHFLRKKLPWLGKIFKGLRRDRRAEGIEGEAVNIDRYGQGPELWKRNPTFSTVWRPRTADELTPTRLFTGPWFGDAPPRLPKSGEVWKLDGFRSQKSDGSHPSVDLADGDAQLKVKFRRGTGGFWEDAPWARLLWAMGYETEAIYNFSDFTMEPRAFLAAHAAVARIGLKFGPESDETIPGRPPRGLSFALSGINNSPGAGNVVVRFKDGHEEGGDGAIDTLKKAMDDRPLMDSMDVVVVKRVYGEVARPGDPDSIGPWDFDADNHVDDREVRALGVIMIGWLAMKDMKFNNVRLDALTPKNGPTTLFHTISDVGTFNAALPDRVGISPDGRFLHPDTNAYTIRAFDRLTTNDAKWAVARIGALTEEQIVACLATGTLSDEMLADYTERMLARRDDLVKTFGLTSELGLLRPEGRPTTVAPRHFP